MPAVDVSHLEVLRTGSWRDIPHSGNDFDRERVNIDVDDKGLLRETNKLALDCNCH